MTEKTMREQAERLVEMARDNCQAEKNSLQARPCNCGGNMMSVLTYDTPDNHPIRTGWFCAKCRAWKKAVSRERAIR